MNEPKLLSKLTVLALIGVMISLLVVPYLGCGPKAEAITVTILGGEAVSADQKAKVIIPSRALSEEADVTITPVEAPVLADGLSVVGEAYEFGPPGITFGSPVMVTLSYRGEDLQGGVVPEEMILATIGEDGQIEPLNSIHVDTEAGTVSGTPDLMAVTRATLASLWAR